LFFCTCFNAIAENLVGEASAQQIRLEWFGLIVSETKGDIPHWHYAEATQAA